MFRYVNHPDFPYDYARGALRESAPQPPTHSSRVRYPLAQLYTHSPPQPVHRPEPQHPVAPHPAPPIPSPLGTVLGLKRKRIPTLEDNEVDNDARKVVNDVPYQAENQEQREPAKRPRLITRQPTLDPRMSTEVGDVPDLPPADPPTRKN
jgi:hypothetical protein